MARRLTISLVALAVASAAGAGSLPAWAAPTAPAGVQAGHSLLSSRLQLLGAVPGLSADTLAATGRSLGLPLTGGGSLVRSAPDRITVEVRVGAADAATLAALTKVGVRVVHASPTWRTVVVDSPVSALKAVAAVRGVRSVHEVLRATVQGSPTAQGMTADATRCGSATTEGDQQLKAAQARTTYGVDGTGQRVGVISDSYDVNPNDSGDAADGVASGDLPGPGNPCGRLTPVTVDDAASGSDEGREMTEIVHDLAPGAALAFQNAGTTGLPGFADSITKLQTEGATVIVDDLGFGDDPFYQQGPAGVAYGQARSAGTLGLVAAGNDKIVTADGKPVTSYETLALRPTGCPAAVAALLPGSSVCHDFKPGAGVDPTFRITVPAFSGIRMNMQWAQPWDGVTTDLDLFGLDTSGSVVASSQDDNLTFQRPHEGLAIDNPTGATQKYDIVVARNSATTGTPRFKMLNTGNGLPLTAFEYPVSSGGDVIGGAEAYGHQGDPDAMSIGATPYNDGVRPEPYSSTGNLTYLFGPVRADGQPAAALAAPQTVLKPDVVGTDNGLLSFGHGDPPYRFGGTSAAAPHVAAVAALMQQAKPGVTPDQLQATLRSTATAMSGTQQEVGSGLVNALAAVGSLVGTQPWSAPASTGRPSPAAGSAAGAYLGVFGESWRLSVTQPSTTRTLYTGTITIDSGSFANVKMVSLGGNDTFSVSGRTITFSFANYGGVDGITFDTPRGASRLTYDLKVNGRPLPARQIYVGSTKRHPAADPFTIGRQPVSG